MKKLLAFLLAAVMLVSLVACTKGGEDDGDTIMGSYDKSSSVYSNDLLDIKFTMNKDWEVFDEEQIAELNGMTKDILSLDEELSEALEKSGSVQVFYAQRDGGLVTANIVIENIGLVYGALIDEKTYAENSVDQVAPALEAMGMADVETEIITVNFAGEDHTAINIHASLFGADFYETMVCMKVGRYIAGVTVGSYVTDETGDVLAMFSELD